MTDLEFLVEVDLRDEGITSTGAEDRTEDELAEHRDKIAAFILDQDKAAWVYEDATTNHLIAMILWRYRNRLHEKFEAWSIFDQLDESLFPPDGSFCEFFQLWVAPEYRRQGLASNLKWKAETESIHRGVKLIYTHTEERNINVIKMNLKLGYREVRRGPIWDEVVRVSLIKSLG